MARLWVLIEENGNDRSQWRIIAATHDTSEAVAWVKRPPLSMGWHRSLVNVPPLISAPMVVMHRRVTYGMIVAVVIAAAAVGAKIAGWF